MQAQPDGIRQGAEEWKSMLFLSRSSIGTRGSDRFVSLGPGRSEWLQALRRGDIDVNSSPCDSSSSADHKPSVPLSRVVSRDPSDLAAINTRFMLPEASAFASLYMSIPSATSKEPSLLRFNQSEAENAEDQEQVMHAESLSYPAEESLCDWLDRDHSLSDDEDCKHADELDAKPSPGASKGNRSSGSISVERVRAALRLRPSSLSLLQEDGTLCSSQELDLFN